MAKPGYVFSLSESEFLALKREVPLTGPLTAVLREARTQDGKVRLYLDPDTLRDLQRCLQRAIRQSKEPALTKCLSAIGDRVDRMVDLEEMDDEPPASISNLLPKEIQDQIRAFQQSHPQAGLRELNRFIAGAVLKYNQSPMPDHANLSPEQIRSLLSADWRQDRGPIRLNPSLTLEELAGASQFTNLRLFLQFAHDSGGFKATARGNLPRKVVRHCLETFVTNRDYQQYLLDYGTFNEDTVRPVNVTRLVAEMAELVRLDKGRFVLTARGAQLLAPEQAGELYRRFFITYFREFNLAYLSQGLELRDLQHTFSYTLVAIDRTLGVWMKACDAWPRIILPAVQNLAPPNQYFDTLEWLTSTCILVPLQEFGLLESRSDDNETQVLRICDFRKSPLWDRFFTFKLD